MKNITSIQNGLVVSVDGVILAISDLQPRAKHHKCGIAGAGTKR